MTEKHLKKIKETAKDLTETLGFSAEVIIVQRNNIFFVNLQIEEPGILIGRGGEGLDSLQHVLRLLLNETINELGTILIVDVNNYREKRLGTVEKMAREIAFRVRSTGAEEELPQMNSFERRVVHMLVSNIADVETESRGERHERKLYIKPKKK